MSLCFGYPDEKVAEERNGGAGHEGFTTKSVRWLGKLPQTILYWIGAAQPTLRLGKWCKWGHGDITSRKSCDRNPIVPRSLCFTSRFILRQVDSIVKNWSLKKSCNSCEQTRDSNFFVWNSEIDRHTNSKTDRQQRRPGHARRGRRLQLNTSSVGMPHSAWLAPTPF